ncbi:MAG TPA: gliding motility-associated C-terminal domain-containing protein, partial [Bacteroidia bacterium]|nr:gliding motility-associated C-terminal domain-containing protein [Bacteroidia bacterium]
GTGSWSVLTGGALLSAQGTSTAIVSGISTGTNTFLWTYNNGVCPSSTAIAVIYRDDFPIANAGVSQTVCAAGTTLAAMTQTFGTGSWSVLTGPATISGTGANVNVSGIVVGNNTFQWTAVNGVCPASVSTVTVYRDMAPLANAGVNQVICASSSTLAAITQSFGTGNWSVLSGGATLSNANTATTNITGIATGTNVFSWTVINGVCPSATASVTVVRDQVPSLAAAGSDQTICSTSTAVNAKSPLTGSGTWSLITGSGIFDDPTQPSTFVSAVSTGTNTFLWLVSNGACPPSYDTLTIKVDAMPTPAFANKDQAVCSPSTTLDANLPATGKSAWKLVSGAGFISDSTSNTSSVNSLSVGANVFIWSIRNGVCPVSSYEVIITRDALPSVASAGLNTHVDKPIASLSAETPSVGTGTWSIIDGLGTFEDPLNPVTNITGLAVGNNAVRWTVKNGVCQESVSDIVIYVDALRIPTGFSPNGDGINDQYVVPGMDYYDNVKFSVFNRWGGLVYQSNNYRNDWNGTNMNNEQLADDTYYYIIKVNPEMDYSGYVIIKAAK